MSVPDALKSHKAYTAAVLHAQASANASRQPFKVMRGNGMKFDVMQGREKGDDVLYIAEPAIAASVAA